MMGIYLRAYLMIQSNDSNWRVEVCRDLDSILNVWHTRKKEDSKVTILHVGFDRPSLQRFDQLQDSYPNTILLTTAAKYTLPNSYSTSQNPVEVIEGLELYLGLDGWGYSLDDHTKDTDYIRKFNQDKVVQEPEGWVSSYLTEYPKDSEIFSRQGIFNESTYLKLEKELDRSVRHRVGLFRTFHIIGNSSVDPCILATYIPPWFSEREVSSLNLPIRVNNAFRFNGINKVNDLKQWSSKELLMLQNFGRKSLNDITVALINGLKEGPFQIETNEEVQETGSFLMEVQRSLLKLTDREKEILVRRIGFNTNPETLENVAKDYDLTRERIRQIEKKAIKKFIRNSNWINKFEKKISCQIIDQTFPLAVAGIEAIDSWFENLSKNQDFLQRLLRVMGSKQIFMIRIEGIFYFSHISQMLWENSVSEAESMLRIAENNSWSLDYVRSLVNGLLPDTAKEFRNYLWDYLSPKCHFSKNPDGEIILTGFGRGAEKIVKSILTSSTTPLHYSEIAEQAKLLGRYKLNEIQALNAAQNVSYLLGRGTYGLRKHIKLNNEQWNKLLNESESVVCSMEIGKQWHTSEILSKVMYRLPNKFDGIDKYILNSVLSDSNVVTSLGRMAWIIDKEEGNSRIQIHQLVVSILQSAKRPMKTKEIKKSLVRVRGVGENFHIFPKDPIIKLSPNLWGLNDRDAFIAREVQQRLISKLVNILEMEQTSIHENEIPDILSLQGCSPYTFLSIASQDKRLKIDRGRNVYLT